MLNRMFMKALIGLLLGCFLSTAGATETVIYYHNDALGSPIAATNAEGQVVWREQYEPYGERLVNEPKSRNQLWYTGKPEEEALGLSYFGARWYAPGLGRFMGMDPVEAQAENLYSFNRYAYANNNPYKFVDPDGNVPIPLIIWGMGAAVTAYNTYQTYQSEGLGAAATTLVIEGAATAALGGAAKLAGPALKVLKGIDKIGDATKSVANPVPETLARVISGKGPFSTLGRTDAEDVFVTGADDIAGMNAAQIQQRLTIKPSSRYTIIEFPTPSSGIASPVNRPDPGFIGGGRTAGGAREFVIPNGSIPAGARVRDVE
jgi:RHS repeat-associated protein